MKMRNINKSVLAVAVGAGLAATPLLSAQAVEIDLYGQINRTIVNLDNGEDSDLSFADNDAGSSRIGVIGSADFGGGEVGVKIEHQFESNSTSGHDIDSAGPLSTGNLIEGGDADSIRKVELYFSGGYGKVSLGQGSDAFDGVTEYDLAGTFGAGIYAYPVDMMGTLTLVDSVTGFHNAAGITVDSVVTTYDGGRRDRIRYDSPSFGAGLGFSASLANAGRTDFSVNGSHSFGESQLAWAAGISELGETGANTEDETTAISGSLLLANGLSFTVSTSEREFDTAAGVNRDDGEHTYFKLGYKTGKHAFAVDAFDSENHVGNDDEASGIGLGWEYSAAKNVSVYLSWREVEFDPGLATAVSFSGQDSEDASALQLGTMVKFSSK